MLQIPSDFAPGEGGVEDVLLSAWALVRIERLDRRIGGLYQGVSLVQLPAHRRGNLFLGGLLGVTDYTKVSVQLRGHELPDRLGDDFVDSVEQHVRVRDNHRHARWVRRQHHLIDHHLGRGGGQDVAGVPVQGFRGPVALGAQAGIDVRLFKRRAARLPTQGAVAELAVVEIGRGRAQRAGQRDRVLDLPDRGLQGLLRLLARDQLQRQLGLDFVHHIGIGHLAVQALVNERAGRDVPECLRLVDEVQALEVEQIL